MAITITMVNEDKAYDEINYSIKNVVKTLNFQINNLFINEYNI